MRCLYIIDIIHCLYIKHPTGICIFKGSKKQPRKRCEICSKLTVKTRQNVFCLLFSLTSFWLSLQLAIISNIFHTLFQSLSLVNFTQVNALWKTKSVVAQQLCNCQSVSLTLISIAARPNLRQKKHHGNNLLEQLFFDC